jgi:hypothetical protein
MNHLKKKLKKYDLSLYWLKDSNKITKLVNPANNVSIPFQSQETLSQRNKNVSQLPVHVWSTSTSYNF